MLFESLRKKKNRSYRGLYQKTSFVIDLGLWEVPKIDGNDYDDDDDENDDNGDDDNADYDVFSSSKGPQTQWASGG